MLSLKKLLNENGSHKIPVNARKTLVHERQFVCAPSFARAIAFNLVELDVRLKICGSEIQSLLLLKHVKCLT